MAWRMAEGNATKAPWEGCAGCRGLYNLFEGEEERGDHGATGRVVQRNGSNGGDGRHRGLAAYDGDHWADAHVDTVGPKYNMNQARERKKRRQDGISIFE
jgi:hypothetical protein